MNPVCLFYKQEAIYLDSSYARLSWRMPGRLCLLLSAPDRDVCTGNGQAAVGVSSLVSLSEFLFFSCFRFRWQGHTQAREMSLFLLYISPHYASIVRTYALLRCLHLIVRITNKLTRKHLINDFFFLFQHVQKTICFSFGLSFPSTYYCPKWQLHCSHRFLPQEKCMQKICYRQIDWHYELA